MREKFLEEIINLHATYLEFFQLTQAKEKEVRAIKNNMPVDIEVPAIEIIEGYTNSYVDYMSFNSELYLVRARLIFYIDLFIKIGGIELPEDIVKFYNDNKGVFTKQSFVIKDGEIIEAEEGILQERRKQFLEGDFYKNMQKMMS